ncbi:MULTISPECIES: DUF1190 domain-containing protein [Lysobacter]|uniref:DUF1190 domain-containing protein n=1 Tax=Lysobacter TaxID=68 RepID=UPI0004D01760|nr:MULTISPECIES: DUF1190 domain-containing protein [Lysobacter]
MTPSTSKRSRNLKLVLMAAAVPALLTGCEDEPSGKVLTSLEECKVQTEIAPAECEAAYYKALVEHEKLAPRFESERECNEQFGACQSAPANPTGGSHSYMPSMSGFLIGYALSQAMQPRGYYGIGGVSPLYRDYRSGGYLRPGGERVSSNSGTVYGKYGNTALPTRAVTVSRSGFGSSAAARGGFGGSSSRGGGGRGG